MELDGRSRHWRESYSPTSRHRDAACLLGRVRDAAGHDAVAIGAAGRVREETEALGLCVGVCAERNQELEWRRLAR